jgi:hypothetical protein
MKISNTSLVILTVFIVLPVIFGPSILASYEEHRIAPFIGTLVIVFGSIGLLFFYHKFWKREEERKNAAIIGAERVVPKVNLARDFVQLFGKFIGLAWIVSWVPIMFGASIAGEIGYNLGEIIGYQPAEFVFLVVSILFVCCMLYLYRIQPSKFGKFLVTFCALISIAILAGIIGHTLSGNEILFGNSFT